MAINVTSTSDTPEQVAAALTPPTPPVEPSAPAPPVAETAAPVEDEVVPVVPAAGDPAAAAAPPVPETPPAETEEEDEDDKEVTEKPPAKDRIGRLKFQRWSAREDARKAALEAQTLKAEVERLKTAPPPAATTTPEPPKFSDPEPNIDDFGSIADWTKAYTKWTEKSVRFDMGQQTVAAQARIEQERQQRADQEILTRHQTRVETYKAAHPEFDAILQRGASDPPPLSPPMSAHIFHSESGPALMEYLDQHREESAKIAAMNYGPALVYLGKLEAKLETSTAEPVAPPAPIARPRAVPPPPITPVGASVTATTKNPDDMTQKEWNSMRRKQGAR